MDMDTSVGRRSVCDLLVQHFCHSPLGTREARGGWHKASGGGLVWFGSRPVPDALAHGQHSPLRRHDWARRIAVVRSQGLPDC